MNPDACVACTSVRISVGVVQLGSGLDGLAHKLSELGVDCRGDVAVNRGSDVNRVSGIIWSPLARRRLLAWKAAF